MLALVKRFSMLCAAKIMAAPISLLGVTMQALVPVFAALGDETRWSILAALGEGDASASALAGRLPVSRQAIAKHLAVLQEVGIVEPVRIGREVQYRVIGAELSATAHRLDAIGAEWDRRVAVIRDIAEGLQK